MRITDTEVENMACNCNCGGKITGLAHIGIMVKDIDASIGFYRDTLGFELTDKVDLGAVKLGFLNIGSCLIELVQTPDYAARVPGTVDHIAVEVVGIEELVCKLVDKGVKFLTDKIEVLPNLLGGVKNIFFTGPDGERLEFFEYTGK